MGTCFGCIKKQKKSPQNGEDSILRLVADYINSGECKNILTMAGAGMSTSTGIPDFRSPETGMYSILKKQYPELDRPEDLFSSNFFKKNPEPFFKRVKGLIQSPDHVDGFNPTPSHYFIKKLSDRGMLLRHYTQNIDGLDRKVGIPEDRLIEAHGTFRTAHCISEACHKEYSEFWIKNLICKDIIPKCDDCGNFVKPDIVFFDDDLPDKFGKNVWSDCYNCDLLIILGTSLKVYPFASILDIVFWNCPDCPILLINRENSAAHWLKQPFGKEESWALWSHSPNRKIFWEGDCDEGFNKLGALLGC